MQGSLARTSTRHIYAAFTTASWLKYGRGPALSHASAAPVFFATRGSSNGIDTPEAPSVTTNLGAPVTDCAATRSGLLGAPSRRQEAERLTVTRVKKTDAQILKEIKALVRKKPVVLFLKGSPDNPQCGFSRKAVNILQEAGCTSVVFVDVLRSERIRELVKELAQWPTIPQLFVGGTFVGGADAMAQMMENGELQALLAKYSSTESSLDGKLGEDKPKE